MEAMDYLIMSSSSILLYLTSGRSVIVTDILNLLICHVYHLFCPPYRVRRFQPLLKLKFYLLNFFMFYAFSIKSSGLTTFGLINIYAEVFVVSSTLILEGFSEPVLVVGDNLEELRSDASTFWLDLFFFFSTMNAIVEFFSLEIRLFTLGLALRTVFGTIIWKIIDQERNSGGVGGN
ncbi:unnamed protein product [Orchesella dallaii]|uniref:Uncharacterized protein n=1 Tax=Orchesella dallaii TaxID=48710 RepID=A0ABP1S7K1_9HEXA